MNTPGRLEHRDLHATGPRLKQLKCLNGQLRHNRKCYAASNLRQTLNIRVKEKQHKEKNLYFYS